MKYVLLTRNINHLETKQEFATREEFNSAYWKAVSDNKVHKIEVG